MAVGPSTAVIVAFLRSRAARLRCRFCALLTRLSSARQRPLFCASPPRDGLSSALDGIQFFLFECSLTVLRVFVAFFLRSFLIRRSASLCGMCRCRGRRCFCCRRRCRCSRLNAVIEHESDCEITIIYKAMFILTHSLARFSVRSSFNQPVSRELSRRSIRMHDARAEHTLRLSFPLTLSPARFFPIHFFRVCVIRCGCNCYRNRDVFIVPLAQVLRAGKNTGRHRRTRAQKTKKRGRKKEYRRQRGESTREKM